MRIDVNKLSFDENKILKKYLIYHGISQTNKESATNDYNHDIVTEKISVKEQPIIQNDITTGDLDSGFVIDIDTSGC